MKGMRTTGINILGRRWRIEERKESEDDRLQGSSGYTDWTTRLIVINADIDGDLGDLEAFRRKVLRHEIVHAYLLECGLHECSNTGIPWADNEEMVDWIAHKGQQIYTTWLEAGAIDDMLCEKVAE